MAMLMVDGGLPERNHLLLYLRFEKWPYSCARIALKGPTCMPSRTPVPRIKQRSEFPDICRIIPPTLHDGEISAGRHVDVVSQAARSDFAGNFVQKSAKDEDDRRA
jgi:hypothetical protein